MCYNQLMRNHEHLHTQPDLTVEGEVYDEFKQRQELSRLADELEAGSRKSEIAKKDIGEAEYARGKLNPWERMAASLPGFNRERAEHARLLAERDKAQKERLKTVETVLEEGSIEGRENELMSALKQLECAATREPASAYNRYLFYKKLDMNPEEHHEKKPRGDDWMAREIYNDESKVIRRIKHFSEGTRNSLDRLVTFEQEQEKKKEQERQMQKEEKWRREREEREKLNEELRRERETEASSQGFESEIAKIRGVENGRMRSPEPTKERRADATPNRQAESETPKPPEKEPEGYQGYQETTELPDQGPDLVDPMSTMFM